MCFSFDLSECHEIMKRVNNNLCVILAKGLKGCLKIVTQEDKFSLQNEIFNQPSQGTLLHDY